MTRHTLLTLAATALLTSTAAAQFFTPGNAVVLRVGDPAITLGSIAAPIFLDEWDTNTNTLVQSLAIPNSSTGATPSTTQRGYSSSEGCLTLSSDGRYLILAGYDRAVGATDPGAEPAISTNRVIVRVDTLTGFIDSSTALTDAYDSSTIRGATSVDGQSRRRSGAALFPRMCQEALNGGAVLTSCGECYAFQLGRSRSSFLVITSRSI